MRFFHFPFSLPDAQHTVNQHAAEDEMIPYVKGVVHIVYVLNVEIFMQLLKNVEE